MLRTLCTLALSLAFALPAAAQCGNPKGGPTPCVAVPNSTGAAAAMCVQPGTTVGKLDLSATSVPASTPGQFLFSLTPSTSGIPFANGSVLCLAGPYTRLSVIASDPSGVMSDTFDPAAYGLGVGDTLYFSAYFRDSVGGSWPANFNFSNGWKVTL